MTSPLVTALVLTLATSLTLTAMTAEPTRLTIADQPLKDLAESLQGADAEAFMIGHRPAAGINLRPLLDQHRQAFAATLAACGNPVLRMAEMNRYSWDGAAATDAVRGDRDSAQWWYDPDEVHRFAREHGLRLIGFLDDYRWYDRDAGRAIDLRDPASKQVERLDDAQLAALTAMNRRKLERVRAGGWADLYVAWEVGNESYAPFRNHPELYARIAAAQVAMAKEVDPAIRLSVPAFICAANDDNLLRGLEREPGGVEDALDRWRVWTARMFAALGPVARDIPFASIHLYGTALRWNANHKGLATHQRFLDGMPNTGHLRMLVTEWRFTAGDDLNGHRSFRFGGLWSAKMTNVLLAHPRVAYTGVHELATFSGAFYVNEGGIWRCQGPAREKPIVPLASAADAPPLALGPFGPVLAMANELVRSHPLLLGRHAGLGDDSGAAFIADAKPGGDDGRDLDWVVAASRDRSALAALVVNTHERAMAVALPAPFTVRQARSLSCPAARVEENAHPADQPWTLAPLAPAADGSVLLPPLSVSLLLSR